MPTGGGVQSDIKVVATAAVDGGGVARLGNLDAPPPVYVDFSSMKAPLRMSFFKGDADSITWKS